VGGGTQLRFVGRWNPSEGKESKTAGRPVRENDTTWEVSDRAAFEPCGPRSEISSKRSVQETS
jgi:hypothetical protein